MRLLLLFGQTLVLWMRVRHDDVGKVRFTHTLREGVTSSGGDCGDTSAVPKEGKVSLILIFLSVHH